MGGPHFRSNPKRKARFMLGGGRIRDVMVGSEGTGFAALPRRFSCEIFPSSWWPRSSLLLGLHATVAEMCRLEVTPGPRRARRLAAQPAPLEPAKVATRTAGCQQAKEAAPAAGKVGRAAARDRPVPAVMAARRGAGTVVRREAEALPAAAVPRAALVPAAVMVEQAALARTEAEAHQVTPVPTCRRRRWSALGRRTRTSA